MNGARAVLAVVLAAAACASGRPQIEQRTTQGPEAEVMWTYRVAVANGREPTFDEKLSWERQLDLAIGRYLAKDQAFANSPELSTFRFARRAVVGMSKEQVTILLGAPERATTDPGEIETLAGKYWPDVRPHATEAWVYPIGWHLYFSDSRVVDITQRYQR